MGTAGDGPSTSTDPPVSSPGVAFCTPLRGPQRRGDLGAEPAVQGTNVLAGQGQGQAGPPPTRAVLTAPRRSRAGLCSALHKCMGRARSRSPAGGRDLGHWGAPAQGRVSGSVQGCKRAPPGEAKQGHVPTLGAGAQHGARSSTPGPWRGWLLGRSDKDTGSPPQDGHTPGQQGQPRPGTTCCSAFLRC